MTDADIAGCEIDGGDAPGEHRWDLHSTNAFGRQAKVTVQVFVPQREGDETGHHTEDPPRQRLALGHVAMSTWRTNRAGRVDPFRLGRIPILQSDGTFFFRRKAAGQLDSEALVYRAMRRGPWGRT